MKTTVLFLALFLIPLHTFVLFCSAIGVFSLGNPQEPRWLRIAFIGVMATWIWILYS